MTAISTPPHAEYPGYYRTYTDLVPEGSILEILADQFEDTARLLRGVPEAQEEYRYGDDKWSVREVVGHCIDTERVFAFRTLWIARGAAGAQPGMDQDAWAATSPAGNRRLADLLEEWQGLRQDVVRMHRGMDDAALMRTGTASDQPFSARSFAWIIAGHELHHRRQLRERYGL